MSNLIQLTKDEKLRFSEWVVQNVTEETVLCDERNLGAMLFNIVHLIRGDGITVGDFDDIKYHGHHDDEVKELEEQSLLFWRKRR